MSEIYVARQPVYDGTLQAHGYELLFRSGPAGAARILDGDTATSQVLVRAFTEIGLERLVGKRLAFVNVTRPFLVGELPLPFAAGSTVLELAGDAPLDEVLVERARHLAAQGYRLALDGVPSELDGHPLLPHVSYVKIDVQRHSPAEQAALIAACRAYLGIRVVAQKVETREEFAAAQAAGFDLFQGYFLSRPSLVGSKALSPKRFVCLDLVAKLSQADVDFDDVESTVRLDVGLAYRVLRSVNSAEFGLRRTISSLREAMVMLGLERLRGWVMLMAVADTGESNAEQLSSAMTRARMCELLASAAGVRADVAFTAGMLSAMDFLLDVPLADVVEQLPLERELADALLLHEGPIGRLLEAVQAYERDDLAGAAAAGLDLIDLSHAYLSSIGWSLQTYPGVVAS